MTTKTLLRRTTVGIAMIAALATTPLAAQESGSSGSAESQTQSDASQLINPEQLVASVGETEITGADVSEFIDSLPPQMRQQPPKRGRLKLGAGRVVHHRLPVFAWLSVRPTL